MARETDRERELRQAKYHKEELRVALHKTLDHWLDLTFASSATYDDGTQRTLKLTLGQQDHVWSGNVEDRKREEI